MFSQNDFSGGLNLSGDPTKIAENEYFLLVNGRTRFRTVRPVKLPIQLTGGLPSSGTCQGLYGLDRYLLAFIDGYAYYRDVSTMTNFVNVESFSMQGGTEIYAVAVPASTTNYARKLSSEIDNSTINLYSQIGGTPICILCQDGINQPWKIYPDGTAEVTQTFLQWTKETSQEYVPIGTLMLYNAYLNKLFILAKDLNNRYTQIFHSVSGRPLDFMINVDSNGDKAASENEGGATSVAYSVGFAEVTAIEAVNAQGGAFFVGTLGASYLVIPNLSYLIFGEPTFNNETFLPTGPTDSQSLADVNGDVAFVDQTGIKSFNSVKQQNNESNSNPFSAKVANLFESIVQTSTAATNFDNYALFAVNSVYGPCILVYDLNTQAFVGIDIYPNVAQILQFASVKISGQKYLFFRTTDNKIYQAFAGDTASCELYAGEWTSSDAKVNMKADKLALAFTKVLESGTVTSTIVMDGIEDISRTQTLAASGVDNTAPRNRPFPTATTRGTLPLLFDFKSSKTGFAVGFWIEWSCDACLSSISVEGNTDTSQVALSQKAALTYNPT